MFPRRFAHSQEVWPQAADRVLGYIGQGLARGSAEQVAPHRFVDTRHILGSQGLVLDAGHVNGEALATDDLRKSTMRRWYWDSQFDLYVIFLACTYHNQSEGDHDSSQQLVGDSVLLERIPDRLIITEETPFEGSMLRCEDEKRKSNCTGKK